LWLADRDAVTSRAPVASFAASENAEGAGGAGGRHPAGNAEPDLGSYRAAVSELVAEFAQFGPSDVERAEDLFGRRLEEKQFTAVLSATPDGRDETITRLVGEIRDYQPVARNNSSSLAALVRISMLAQIDSVWWGRYRGYQTDEDVLESADLVDLDELSAQGQLRFRYRHQVDSLIGRAARSAERRTLPGRSPRTAGLWLDQTAGGRLAQPARGRVRPDRAPRDTAALGH